MKLLVGYTGSRGSIRVVENALARAKKSGAEVFVVTSLRGHGEPAGDDQELKPRAGEGPIVDPHEALDLRQRYELEIKRAENALREVRALFAKEGVRCTSHVLIRGEEPGEDIVRFAKQHEVDEIIIGVRKRSSVAQMLFGSVARHIIEEAPCPVVTVRI